MRQSIKFIAILCLCFLFASSRSYAQSDPSDAIIPSDSVTAAPVIAQPPANTTVLDTLEIKDMDINDVLKLLAAKSGLNIIAGKSISGRVTIFLQNVDVRDALTIILKSNDLAYIEDRGVIQIVSGAEYEQTNGHKFGVRTESAVIPLQTMKASDAVILLNQVKSQSGKVIADDQSNSLIIEEVPEKLKRMLDYIRTVDVATDIKVYKLQYVSGEALSTKLQEMVSPKIGSVKFDAASNKLFIKDTPKRLEVIDNFIKQIDIARETKVFAISYAKAEDLAKAVTPLLTKEIGSMQFDGRSNTIIVMDIPPKLEEIGAVIAALDKTDKEVLIEAKIVQVELSDTYAMGIDWEKLIPNASHAVVQLTNNFSLPAATAPVSVAQIGTLDRDGYQVVLQMIATLGKSRILSSPQIAVVNNQEASILVGTTTPYVTSSTTTPATGTPVTAESVNFIDTGVKLHVTPVIHDDGYVSMKIKPEVSNLDPNPLKTADNNFIPVVNTSEVQTTIRVKDGVTIVIGGLIKDQIDNTKNKIPVLGDLPLVGKAFRSETRNSIKSEIIIFLTPHIISGDTRVDPDTYHYPKAKTNRTYYDPLPKDRETVPVP